MAISGKIGAVQVQTGAAPVAFTDQATTKNGSNDVYYITDRTKAYWDRTAPITVKKNGAVITTGFVVEPCGGFIRFNPANIGTDVILVSATALTVTAAGGFTNWSLDLSSETGDVTTFASGGWKEIQPLLLEWAASAECFWGGSNFFTNLGKELVISLYIDSTTSKSRYEGYAVVTSNSVEGPTDDFINESIEFQGLGAIYYREG